LNEKLESKFSEAWQIIGDSCAAEDGSFVVLQLCVEEGDKVVQLSPRRISELATSVKYTMEINIENHEYS
jgi:hypothetical protein